MKMIVNVTLPIEPFNSMVINGTAGELMGRIIDETKPESIYFTESDGHRAATMVVDVENASDIPTLCEPWFLKFEAMCEFNIAMSPDDLMKANLPELGKKWN